MACCYVPARSKPVNIVIEQEDAGSYCLLLAQGSSATANDGSARARELHFTIPRSYYVQVTVQPRNTAEAAAAGVFFRQRKTPEQALAALSLKVKLLVPRPS